MHFVKFNLELYKKNYPRKMYHHTAKFFNFSPNNSETAKN